MLRVGDRATLDPPAGGCYILPMLRFLFPRLTSPQPRGAGGFARIVAEAREPHWYVAGGVPDTVDGRFRVLAALTGLVIARVEESEQGVEVSAALTERFIDAMEAEHREFGLGDPALGRTVRKLVGSLARRAALWKTVAAGTAKWDDTTIENLYPDQGSGPQTVHSTDTFQKLWTTLEGSTLEEIAEGRWP